MSEDNPLDSWNWFGVGLMAPEDRIWSSRIEEDPARFGYEILDDSSSPMAWRNPQMDSEAAADLASQFNGELESRSKLGGWMLNPLKGIGFSTERARQFSKGGIPWQELREGRHRFVADYLRRKLHVA